MFQSPGGKHTEKKSGQSLLHLLGAVECLQLMLGAHSIYHSHNRPLSTPAMHMYTAYIKQYTTTLYGSVKELKELCLVFHMQHTQHLSYPLIILSQFLPDLTSNFMFSCTAALILEQVHFCKPFSPSVMSLLTALLARPVHKLCNSFHYCVTFIVLTLDISCIGVSAISRFHLLLSSLDVCFIPWVVSVVVSLLFELFLRSSG